MCTVHFVVSEGVRYGALFGMPSDCQYTEGLFFKEGYNSSGTANPNQRCL